MLDARLDARPELHGCWGRLRRWLSVPRLPPCPALPLLRRLRFSLASLLRPAWARALLPGAHPDLPSSPAPTPTARRRARPPGHCGQPGSAPPRPTALHVNFRSPYRGAMLCGQKLGGMRNVCGPGTRATCSRRAAAWRLPAPRAIPAIVRVGDSPAALPRRAQPSPAGQPSLAGAGYSNPSLIPSGPEQGRPARRADLRCVLPTLGSAGAEAIAPARQVSARLGPQVAARPLATWRPRRGADAAICCCALSPCHGSILPRRPLPAPWGRPLGQARQARYPSTRPGVAARTHRWVVSRLSPCSAWAGRGAGFARWWVRWRFTPRRGRAAPYDIA